jgi:hypothetical protein
LLSVVVPIQKIKLQAACLAAFNPPKATDPAEAIKDEHQ